MIITWEGRDETGRCRLQAESQLYDGVPPIDSLLLDKDLITVNRDVIGVASALTFAPYCEGELRLPKPVSPEAATAIERFLEPATVRVSNVDYEPFEAPKGNGSIYLDCWSTFSMPIPNRWGAPRTTNLTVLDSTEFTGGIYSMNGAAIASNSRAMSDLWPAHYNYGPYLAVALLFAETFQASTIYVNSEMFSKSELYGKAANLIEGCNMRLLSLEKDHQKQPAISWLSRHPAPELDEQPTSR